MEEYGFVYVWHDRKHKRFYVGCRWGSEDDGYVCSSVWMTKAYRRRPQDFKRRIVAKVYTDRKDLLREEHRWLQMIKPEELGKRYYNLRNHHFGHWTADEDKRLTVGEKISQSHAKPETKQKQRDDKLGDRNPMKRPEVVVKRLETWAKSEHVPWNKGNKAPRKSRAHGISLEERGRRISAAKKGKPFTKEHKQALRDAKKREPMRPYRRKHEG